MLLTIADCGPFGGAAFDPRRLRFFGRFFALLRVFAALLAGANRMPFWRFFAFNALGGAVWAVVFGAGAYVLGSKLEQLLGPIGAGSLVAAALGLVAMAVVFRRNQARL